MTRRTREANPLQGSLFDFDDLIAEAAAEPAAPALHPYPRRNDAGETVWACCESAIGPTCKHRTPPELPTKPAPVLEVRPPAPTNVAPTVPSGAISRIKANIAAVQTLAIVRQEARPATTDETARLAAWSGWGAVPEVFDTRHESLQTYRDQLAAFLNPAELAAASRSTLNAHYTDPAVVAAMWDAVAGLGFTGGKVLEPGCGSGNFIAAAPEGAQMTGVELDPTTAGICAVRCPQARIITGSFADMKAPDGSYDLVIGNVPFGKVALHDTRHNRGKHSIHNHFIVKSLHLVRPGGLVALLTSRYTLDAEATTARAEMGDLADLVAAIRLPSGAHQRTAGTRVVMDLLVFRRREAGSPPARSDWLETQPLELDGEQIEVNARFHPFGGGVVLGTMRVAEHGMYGRNDLEVEPDGDWLVSLADHANAVARSALRWTPEAAVAAPAPVHEPEAADVQEGFITRKPDGSFRRAENGAWVPHSAPRTQAKELAALLALRDAAVAVLTEETTNLDASPALDSMRKRLATRYADYVSSYGHLNRVTERRTGRTHPQTGEEIMARVRPPMGGFRADPYAPLVFALEEYDPESQTAAPAPIQTQRVVVPRIPPDKADNPADALAVCMDTHGRIDLDVIASLLSTTKADARHALAGLVFEDPDSQQLVIGAEYLSGNVRAKLAAAEAAAHLDRAYAANVTALREVIPADLTPAEIDGRLGAAWIDAAYVEQFLREILDDRYLSVESPGGQIWSVDGREYSVQAKSTWGTQRMPAPKLAEALLEQRTIEVKDPIPDPYDYRKTKYILNIEETAAAMEKAMAMQERFGEWLWEDPRRASELARIYNEKFNNIVLRSYDGMKLTLPGLSAALTLRDHQHAAVARIRSEPATGLFHDVGAGKTLEMICGAMELRRLGLIRKPCVVVPNHMLDQFAGEWLRAYPLARVLITRQEDLQGDNRRRLVARVATGDWDGVIMSSSAFERIAMSPQSQADYLRREELQIEAWLEGANGGRHYRTVKRIEAALLKATERVKAKLDGPKDRGIYFEETGIDYLFIDEAHRYKNLRTPSQIRGAGIDGSQRATDLDMKVMWLRERNGSRVVTFATATPVANSITEMNVVTRYLRPDLLEDAGIEVFDTWAATFGETVQEVELAPEGGGTFRLNTRFAKFRNVPELLRMFGVFADVKTAEDLDLEAPLIMQRDDGQRAARTFLVPSTPDLKAYVRSLGDRAGKIRLKQVKPEEDNMLKVSGDGRSAALDLRLVGSVQEEAGKVAAAAGEIHRIWLENRDRVYNGPGGLPSPVRGALQLVFCDLGTPHDGRWHAYGELRDQLAALGMPAGMVRYIHEAKTDRAKAALFAACRSGAVAVLVGSTEKMGVGTNVQDRAVAVHHLDAPWRPADVRQRDGRVVRQLNQNPEVHVIRYAVEGSFDGYMWQTLERKAKFIAQVMRGRIDLREIDDIGDTALSYAEVKALATGNPLLMDHAKAAAALTMLERAERAHNRAQGLLRYTITELTQRAERLRAEAADCDVAAAQRTDVGTPFSMTVGLDDYDRKPDAGLALSEQIRSMVRTARDTGSNQSMKVGSLAGFTLAVAAYPYAESLIYLTLDGAPGCEISVGAMKARNGPELIDALTGRLDRLDDHKDECQRIAERCDSELVHANEQLGVPFAKARELAAAQAELARIDAALDELARKEQDRAPENRVA